MGRAENKVASKLVALTAAHSGFAEKVHNEGHIGCPDYILTFPEGVHRVETKAPGGKLAPMQYYYHGKLLEVGMIVFVPRAVADVERWFKIGRPPVRYV